MPKKHQIHLSPEQRQELQSIVDFGKAAASKRLRAQMLLATDTSQPKGSMVDTDIACVLGASVRSIERMRCGFG